MMRPVRALPELLKPLSNPLLATNYLLFFALLGLVIPYLGLFLQGRGFSGEQIGQVLALFGLTRVISPNIWAWLADRLGQRAFIIKLGSWLSLCCFLPLLFGHSKPLTIAALIGFSFFWTAILPQLEALTMASLGAERQRYARLRAWGSLGFIVTSSLAGWLLGDWGSEALVTMGLLLLAGLWLATLPLRDLNHDMADERNPATNSRWGKPLLLLLAVMFLLQLSHGPYNGFYVLYLLAHQHSSAEAGLLVALGVVAEIVLFFYAAPLLQRFALRHLLWLACGLSLIRWGGIALAADQLWWLALLQLLHAASFALGHAVAIQWLHSQLSPAHRSRGQALYLSFCFGLAGVCGALFTGSLWQEGAGGPLAFAVAAAIAGLALLLGLLLPEPKL